MVGYSLPDVSLRWLFPPGCVPKVGLCPCYAPKVGYVPVMPLRWVYPS